MLLYSAFSEVCAHTFEKFYLQVKAATLNGFGTLMHLAKTDSVPHSES
jgi:hypothetical protein